MSFHDAPTQALTMSLNRTHSIGYALGGCRVRVGMCKYRCGQIWPIAKAYSNSSIIVIGIRCPNTYTQHDKPKMNQYLLWPYSIYNLLDRAEMSIRKKGALRGVQINVLTKQDSNGGRASTGSWILYEREFRSVACFQRIGWRNVQRVIGE